MLIAQLLAVDVVVMDQTFAIDPVKGFQGLCTAKRALSLTTSGFDYGDATGPMQDYATATLAANFRFMGMKSESITAMGIDQKPVQCEAILREVERQIEELVAHWY